MEKIMNILDELNEIVKDYRDGVTLTEDSVFAQLGFDSLDRVELIMAVEEKFDITFPDDIQIETVKELIDKINELKA
jgi:acyl carrier protein